MKISPLVMNFILAVTVSIKTVVNPFSVKRK